MKAQSLRRFLVVRLVVFVLPLLAVGVWFHWRAERGLLVKVFEDRLISRAHTLATLMAANAEDPGAVLAEYMPGFRNASDQDFFQVWSPDGEVLHRSPSLGTSELPAIFGTESEPMSFEAHGPGGVRIHAIGIRFRARPSVANGISMSEFGVVVGAHNDALVTSLRGGLIEVLAAAGVTLLSLSVAIFISLRQGLNLIDRVVGTVRKINPRDLGQTLSLADVPSEIQPFVSTLNDSMALANELYDQERSFNANVAHELRTPVSEIRAAADVALRYPNQADSTEALQDVLRVSIQMGQMIDALLRISRLQAHELQFEYHRLDLSLALKDRCTALSNESPDGSRIDAHYVGDLHTTTHESTWDMVVNNLLSNALEHSEPGTRIDVSMTQVEGGVLLEVENAAPGLSRDQVGHLTERLWRGNPRAGASEHSGLGLAIVAAACHRLGWSLAFDLQDARLKVRLRVPTSHARSEGPAGGAVSKTS